MKRVYKRGTGIEFKLFMQAVENGIDQIKSEADGLGQKLERFYEIAEQCV